MIFSGGKHTIKELKYLTLRLSGMRITEEYMLLSDGVQTEVLYCELTYRDGEEEKIRKRHTVCDTQTVLDTLNRFGIMQWDGFYGKHPRGVLDGTAFQFAAVVNGGQKLSASGSQNFPRHFYELEAWFYGLLKDCAEEK